MLNATLLFIYNAVSIYMIKISCNMANADKGYLIITILFSIIELIAAPFTIVFYVKWIKEWLYINEDIDNIDSKKGKK